nr:MAG TPA: YvrJ protein family protein [Bacteriophage sp.]
MDVDVVTDLVSNVAFPIAAFVMMYYSNTKTIEELRNTIDENSLIMTKLTEKLDNLTTKEA